MRWWGENCLIHRKKTNHLYYKHGLYDRLGRDLKVLKKYVRNLLTLSTGKSL